MNNDDKVDRLMKVGLYMIEIGFPKDEMDAAINTIKMVQITNALAESRKDKEREQ